MRKNLNKLATLALSGMMVMSMAVPAFAQNVNFEKRVHTDGKTLAPNTTFNFKVTPAKQAGSYTYVGQEDNKEHTETTKPGPADGITVTGASFTPQPKVFGEKTDGDYRVFKSNAVIHVDESKFEDFGFYEYDMVEDVNDENRYEGVYYTKSEFKIFVLKYQEGGQVKFATSVVRAKKDNGASDNSKVTGVDNNYGREVPPNDNPDLPPYTPDPNKPKEEHPYDTTHEVTVRKRILGKLANQSEKFKFYVTVVPADKKGQKGNELYNVEVEGNANLGGIEAFTAGVESATPIVVGNNDGFTITGLTKGDKVIVREDATNNTYTMTAGAVTGKEDYVSKVADVVDYTTSFNALKDKAEVDIKNTKEVATPTGIVMNVAPYAMMLAVAGGLGVVFMNRKKEEE